MIGIRVSMANRIRSDKRDSPARRSGLSVREMGPCILFTTEVSRSTIMMRISRARPAGAGRTIRWLVLAAGLASLAAHAAPGVGDPAPGFSLPGSDGGTHTLSELRGSWVVIAFFPKAFTGG
jgi:hypothetical protein